MKKIFNKAIIYLQIYYKWRVETFIKNYNIFQSFSIMFAHFQNVVCFVPVIYEGNFK